MLVIFLVLLVLMIISVGGWLIWSSNMQKKMKAKQWEADPKPKIAQIPAPKPEPKPIPEPKPAVKKASPETSQEPEAKKVNAIQRPTGLGIHIGFGTSNIKEGKRIGAPLHYRGKQHLLLCGPSRLDKSRDFLTPTLLDHDASMVVIDPKGEFAVVTARRRREMGHEVFILNPFGVLQNNLNFRGFPYAASYNPLADITIDSPNFMASITQLADALAWETGSSVKWSNEVREFVTIVLMWICSAVPEEKRNLNEFYDIIMQEPTVIDTWIKRVSRDGFPALSKLAAKFVGFSTSKSAFLVNLRSQVNWLSNPSIKKVIGNSDFSFADLKQKKMTVYLILPEKHLSSLSRWLRLLVLTGTQVNMQSDAASVKPVLFLLTEFIGLNKIASVENWLASLLEKSVQLYISVQSLHPLKTIYKENWAFFPEMAGASIFLAPGDMFTAEYIAKRSSKKNHDKGHASDRAGSLIIKPNEVMQLADYKAVMFKQGSNQPVVIRRMDYREIKEYQGLFDPNPSLPALDG